MKQLYIRPRTVGVAFAPETLCAMSETIGRGSGSGGNIPEAKESLNITDLDNPFGENAWE